MRRILCVALTALLLFSLAACGEKKPPQTDGTEDVTAAATETVFQTEAQTEAQTEEPTKGSHDVISLDFIKTFDQTPAIEEQSVYEKDGVSVKAKSLSYDTVSGPQILLEVKNDSDAEALIQNNYTVVNGFMMKPDINVKVAPHKKAQAQMSLPYLGLAMADIHSLHDIEFSLRLLDSKTYKVLDTTEPVQLVLTGISDELPEFDTSGQTAYDDKGVKVILKGVKQDTLFDSANVVMVYMENNTGNTIAVQNSKLTVNGYNITAAMETILLPGKCAVDMIELYDSELDEHGCTVLDTVDVIFEVNDYEEWKPIATTDKISVELPTEAPTDSAAESADADETVEPTE